MRTDMNFAEKQAYEDGYRDCRVDLMDEVESRLNRGESLREWLVKARATWSH